ncbi:poly-beta-1,6-N-acetyl-D-glucosamine biosynthesis protein PgaD [Chromohalobacter marismortui]|uniref:Poly-beta-1,6-N-acetyl-D-glucosamine biosynthesis protein PgaD n=1 Tax=Chromohalobacter marismortui TaxID=42055 RepID=A0A4R7NF08_9GAMM|nr:MULTISPECIES: poly-beta-1,6-N-acetyl-D-glucosamine biosynthesis protein PgaD [Chromohalobacter]MCI0511077.1 poly-beta-1,6-N-acetyl-D-glucosamine biosynthesis protein PgaD [Chromohalobacter sp.]MCI0593181.1 poly-beta-1,6-N-acetyl-D-glucosamine biosynthesis protein PgaD [Chromohalobacter sp.]TDU19104.1 poly-beta-1,6-N-acetyl-D-glucosamine biosynthesis protein PgaD [Chromohalobacter marismortui]
MRDETVMLELPDIIQRPDLQSRRQRGVFALLSGLGWMLWLYLFLPLSTLLGWAFGSVRFEAYVIDSHEHSWASLSIYAVTVGLAGMALLLWAFYNYRRFRHADRRRPPAPLTTERLATSFGVRDAQVEHLQRSHVTTLRHDAWGHIVAIETVSGPCSEAIE